MRFTTALLALAGAVALTVSPDVVTHVAAQPDSDAPFPSLMIPVHPGYYMGATQDKTLVYACPPAEGTTTPSATDCPALGEAHKGASFKVPDSKPFTKVVNKGTPDEVEWVRIAYRQDIRKNGGTWAPQAWVARHAAASSGSFYSCKEGAEDNWGMVCTAEQAAQKLPLKLFTATDDMSDGEAWRTIEITSSKTLWLYKAPLETKTSWSLKAHDHAVIVLRDPVVRGGRTWWLVAREVKGETQLGWLPDQLAAGSKWPTFRNSEREMEYMEVGYEAIAAARRAAEPRR